MQKIYTVKGDGFDFTPAGILLLAGDTAYGSPLQITAIGRLNASDFIKRVLLNAVAAGYRHGDLLLTLLQWNVQSERVRTMAQEACAVAGDKVAESVFSSYGVSITMQTVSMLFGRPLTSVQPMRGHFGKNDIVEK